MPRKTISVVTGEKYHVYNRGVDKRVIFKNKKDYLRFYQSLEVFNAIEPSHNYEAAKNKTRTDSDRLVQIYAYSLLPNHFHFIIEQLTDGGISEFMKRIQGGYTSYFNEYNQRSGSLFQGRYKRVHIDSDEYYQYLFAYVNENHYVHNLSRSDDIYLSSSNHYQKKMNSKILPVYTSKYNFPEAKALAISISKRRLFEKLEN